MGKPPFKKGDRVLLDIGLADRREDEQPQAWNTTVGGLPKAIVLSVRWHEDEGQWIAKVQMDGWNYSDEIETSHMQPMNAVDQLGELA